MSSLSYTMRDSATMLRRNLRHQLRYPTLLVFQIGVPIILLLLFVYVFGSTMGDGLGGPGGGRGDYLDFVTPGILLIGLASVAQNTAISVSMDMTEGIIARFRTMAIARGSVLTGHVVNSVLQMLVVSVVVVAVALALGFRTTAGPVEWLLATGAVTLIAFALTWLSVSLGLAAKTVESASNAPMPLILLPFLGSGFVPTETMPTAMRWFADYQPFTPMIDLLRGLLTGGPIGSSGWLTVAWSVAIALVGYLIARRGYERISDR